MENARSLDRREFTTEAVLAALAGVVVLVSQAACGGSGSAPGAPNTPTPPAPAADEAGQISSNHGHSAMVTGAQLLAGSQVQLDIRGAADHTHVVTLSAAALQAIRAGRAVSTESTNGNGHVHAVLFNPESPEPPSDY